MTTRAQPEAGAPELVIVGAGPVGLFAAYYAGFRGLRWLILESLPFVGGQIATFYAQSAIYDVPGFPEVRGDELLQRLEAQARSFAGEIRLGTRVTGYERTKGGIRIAWSRENEECEPEPIEVPAILLTTGIGRFAPQPMPDPQIQSWNGKGLTYHLDDPTRLSGRRALVAGGTQRGVEIALALAEAGAETTLIHRRDRLAIPQDLRDRFDASAVSFRPHRELAAIEGSATVERAILSDRRDGTSETVEVDAIIPCFGFAAHRDDLAGRGTTAVDGAITVDSTMAAAPGVWAAGDAASYPGKVRVLAADFGEACTAVNNLTSALVPDAPVFPGYSSHRAGAARRPE